MSAAILSRPTKSGCNWNALGNPVIFKLRREDNTISQINDNGGFAQMQFNGLLIDSYYQVGNTVYLHPAGSYGGLAVITASTTGGGNTLVTLDIAYAGAALGGAVFNTSKRTDYRVEYNFKSVAGVELLDSDLAISPDSTGIMLMNASLLKNLLSATWTPAVSFVEADTDGDIEFYLAYQEYYDGALQGSVTNDSGNPIHGILGANQIGSADGSNMLAYYISGSTSKWLTRFQLSTVLKGLRIWRDWPFTLCFIRPTSLTGLLLRTIEYNAAGVFVDTSSNTIVADFANFINRVAIPEPTTSAVTRILSYLVSTVAGSYSAVTITNGTFTGSAAPWINNAALAGTDWTYNANTVEVALPGSNDNSRIFSQTLPTPITGIRDGYVRMNIDILIPNTKQVDIFIYDGTGTQLGVLNNVVGNGSSSVQVVTSFQITFQDSITEIGFRVESDDATGGNIIVTSVTFEKANANIVSEILDIEVDDACEYDEDNLPIPGQNPIMLQWKNSLGGDAQWLFPFYHEASYNLKGRKAKRLILFDQDLSAVQWEALQELISTNEVYSPPIIDLENTNTINSTSKQVGKQVYMIDQDGNKTGVIVIPNSDRINARDPSHRIAIEIQLPEFQEV